MVAVLIPSQLTAYTAGATRVQAAGATVDAVLKDLDASYPGLRFRLVDEQDRIRKHMRLFVGLTETRSVTQTLADTDELLIFGALSGG